jgi:hypothetical protein
LDRTAVDQEPGPLTERSDVTDILDVLQSQVGTRTAADGTSKYGKWLDAQSPVTHSYAKADWCASSMLYCIAQIPDGLKAIGGLHKSDAYVQSWHNRMKKLGRVSQTAAARRIVFYDWSGTGPEDNHTGIVKSVSGKTMHVYEGNHDNKFELVTRKIDSQVTGFAEWWSFVDSDDTVMVVSLGA